MNVVVYGMNITVSERDREYAEKKLTKLDRYLPNIVEARIELGNEKNKNKEQPVAQLTIKNTRGVILRAEDKKQQDIRAAIDVVIDKMHRQIERYKGKVRHRSNDKWATPVYEEELAEVEEAPVEEVIEDYDSLPKTEVVRRKAVMLTPMSEHEAIDQMELLGHNFFLFYNGTEETINVLYRREDGQYGILTPQVD